MDEIEIEVFRADTRASRGITADDIAAVAEFDCDANPIGCVIGHPKSDTPTDGVIKKFRAEGSKLFATVANVTTSLIDGIREKRILNRSMAFFDPSHPANPTPGKLAPRHLGFLGASAPGIPGMAKLENAFSFNAEDELVVEGDPAEAIIFEAPATAVRRIQEEKPSMTPEEIEAEKLRLAKIEADNKAAADKLAADRLAFTAEQDATRAAANKSRVAALVTARKVLPADAGALELVFNALDSGELEFAADDKGSAADKLVAIMSKGADLVDNDGKPISPKGKRREFSADATTSQAEITTAARSLMAEDKTLTFDAAVERVISQEA